MLLRLGLAAVSAIGASVGDDCGGCDIADMPIRNGHCVESQMLFEPGTPCHVKCDPGLKPDCGKAYCDAEACAWIAHSSIGYVTSINCTGTPEPTPPAPSPPGPTPSIACPPVDVGVPTYDPVGALYGTDYPWASSLVDWSCVFNVANFGGSFDKAQAAAVAAGGGVVYFPPGEHQIKEHLNLKSGVVIRGAPTNASALAGKSPGKLAPKTVLKCPDRAHLGIFNAEPDAHNLGVVNVDLDACAVMLWPALGPNPVSMKTYWYYATEILGMGKNKLVLGNRVRNVNYGHSSPADGDWGKATIKGTAWPWSFSTAIALYSDENGLVANNVLPQADAKSSMKYIDRTVPYTYDQRYGIDVNKQLLGGAYGKLVPGANPSACVGTPKEFPWNFRRGLAIRSNYVFQNGRVGISWTGAGDGKTKGSGTQVVGNHVEMAKGTTFYGFNGQKKPGNSATNENRGYDQAGWENNVTGNSGHIHRQQIVDSSYSTVDGEGLLVQCNIGNSQYRNIWAHNDFSGGTSGYILYWGVDEVKDCELIGNKAASGQKVGFAQVKMEATFRSNKCSNNSPACTCSPAKGTDSCGWKGVEPNDVVFI